MSTRKCRAAVFTGAGEPLELTELPVPATLRDGEALVRVTCCTLCGSDLHSYSGDREVLTPTILGHEILGTIEAVGGRTPLAIGQRVTWSIAASCGECYFCRNDLPQKCERLFKYGHEQMSEEHPLSGGLATHCHLAPGTTVVEIPSGLPDEVACPANCATATVAATG